MPAMTPKELNARLDAENCNQLPGLRFGPDREPTAEMVAAALDALKARPGEYYAIPDVETVWRAMWAAWEENQNANP